MPTEKEKKIYKIIMLAMGVIALGVGIYMVVAMVSGAQNYFTLHFAVPIVLIAVAVIAFIMPIATKTRFSGDAKDEVMKVVAIILILFAILTCVLSYFNFFG